MSGWTRYTVERSGKATSTPAPIDTSERAPASRAMAHVSGAASEPISANGAADAHATFPNTARNGTWTMDASGIQWAFDGIGNVGSAGMTPPTSAKIHTKSTLKPCPDWRARATST